MFELKQTIKRQALSIVQARKMVEAAKVLQPHRIELRALHSWKTREGDAVFCGASGCLIVSDLEGARTWLEAEVDGSPLSIAIEESQHGINGRIEIAITF